MNARQRLVGLCLGLFCYTFVPNALATDDRDVFFTNWVEWGSIGKSWCEPLDAIFGDSLKLDALPRTRAIIPCVPFQLLLNARVSIICKRFYAMLGGVSARGCIGLSEQLHETLELPFPWWLSGRLPPLGGACSLGRGLGVREENLRRGFRVREGLTNLDDRGAFVRIPAPALLKELPEGTSDFA